MVNIIEVPGSRRSPGISGEAGRTTKRKLNCFVDHLFLRRAPGA